MKLISHFGPVWVVPTQYETAVVAAMLQENGREAWEYAVLGTCAVMAQLCHGMCPTSICVL
jgi:hypothetical protein